MSKFKLGSRASARRCWQWMGALQLQSPSHSGLTWSKAASGRRASGRKASDRKASDRRASASRASDRRASDRRASDRRASEPQGIGPQGIGPQGIGPQGIGPQGIGPQGIGPQGIGPQGWTFQGISFQGIGPQGIGPQGIGPQGIGPQGIGPQGMQLRGIDRFQADVRFLVHRGIARANFIPPLQSLQGVQSGEARTYTEVSNPMRNAKLQSGPNDDRAGSFIYVEGSSGAAVDLTGSFWNFVLADTCTDSSQCAAPATCVDNACVEVCTPETLCTTDGASCVHGSCSDVGGRDRALRLGRRDGHAHQLVEIPVERRRLPLHGLLPTAVDRTVVVALPGRCRRPARPTAMAVPSIRSTTATLARSKFTFACTATGVAAKCARTWGYKPWKTEPISFVTPRDVPDPTASIPFAPFYDACLVAARADVLPGRQQLHEERDAGRSVRLARWWVHVDQPDRRTALRAQLTGDHAARGVPDLGARSDDAAAADAGAAPRILGRATS